MSKTILTILTCAIWGSAAVADISETFTKSDETPWNGSADLTWTGDVGTLDISGNRAEKPLTGQTTIVTDMGTTGYDLGRAWQGTIGADSSVSVNANQYGGLILASSSSDASAIEAGTMTGYRLFWASGDVLDLQEASGAGWGSISTISIGSANFNTDPTFTASVTAGGLFSFSDGTTNGTYNAGGAVTLGQYSGFSFASISDRPLFVDDFSVTAIPEPATLSLILGSGAGLLWIRRKFTI